MDEERDETLIVVVSEQARLPDSNVVAAVRLVITRQKLWVAASLCWLAYISTI